MIKPVFSTFFAIAMAVALVMPASAVEMPPGHVWAKPSAAELGIPADHMPMYLGQTQFDAFVPETGHSVTGYMLDYWRANGAASVYGNPISQPFGYNDLYSQAFERGIFQYSPYWVYSDDATVRLAPIVKEDILSLIHI